MEGGERMNKNAIYADKYKKKNIKRIPLDVQKKEYEEIIKPAAECAGLPVNTFIKEAIREKIDRMKEAGDFY